MIILKLRTLARIALASSIGIACNVAQAEVTNFDVYKTAFYQQSSDLQPSDPFGFRFDSRVFFNNPDDLTSVTTTYGGPLSPLEYVAETSLLFRYSSTFDDPLYATQSDMDARFPNGASYTFQIDGGTLGTQTAVLDTPTDTFYPAEIPFLTGSTFSQLQGLDPTQSLLINWNGFASVPGANASFIFFLIFRASDGLLVLVVSGSG